MYMRVNGQDMNPNTLSQISRRQRLSRWGTSGWTSQCSSLGSRTRTICRIGSHATNGRETGSRFLTESHDFIHLSLFQHMIVKLLNILRSSVNHMIIRQKQFKNCLPETSDFYMQALGPERHRWYVISVQNSHAKLSLLFRIFLRCSRWLMILQTFCELFPYRYLVSLPPRKQSSVRSKGGKRLKKDVENLVLEFHEQQLRGSDQLIPSIHWSKNSQTHDIHGKNQ